MTKTSRDRPKSAPYPRLENSKKTSKCQVFFYRSRKSKIFRKKLHTQKNEKNGPTGVLTSHNAEKLKGGTLWGFSTSLLSQSMKKLKKKIFFLFSGKNLTMPKKTERRNPLGFSNIHSVAKHQKKCRGDPLRKKISKKKFRKKMSRSAEKNWKGGLFGLSRYGMLRGKTGKTILVQFARPNGAIWHHNIL